MWQRATTGASGGAVSLDNVKIYMTEDTASGTFTLSANPKMVGASYVQTQKYPKDPWVELKDGDTGVRLSDGNYYVTLSRNGNVISWTKSSTYVGYIFVVEITE